MIDQKSLPRRTGNIEQFLFYLDLDKFFQNFFLINGTHANVYFLSNLVSHRSGKDRIPFSDGMK